MSVHTKNAHMEYLRLNVKRIQLVDEVRSGKAMQRKLNEIQAAKQELRYTAMKNALAEQIRCKKQELIEVRLQMRKLHSKLPTQLIQMLRSTKMVSAGETAI